jgi:hypothetical protein
MSNAAAAILETIRETPGVETEEIYRAFSPVLNRESVDAILAELEEAREIRSRRDKLWTTDYPLILT